MNHEKLRTEQLENNGRTEWDTLGEQVEFKNESEKVGEEQKTPEKSEQEIFKEQYDIIFDKVYGRDIGGLIVRSCGEKGSDGKIDFFASNNALEELITEEEQEKAFNQILNGKPIDGEIREKIRANMLDLIVNTGMVEEIVADPFLRKSHADELAGRLEDVDLNDPESVRRMHLNDILHNADGYFFGSDEAQGLLTDRDFIITKFMVQKAVEKTDKEASGMSEDEITDYYINDISKTITKMCEAGETSIRELVDDPYLRRERFDSLYDMEVNKDNISEDKKNFWQYDVDFEKSYLGSEVRRYATQNPELYNEEYYAEETEAITEEVVEKISEEQLKEIVKAYEKNPREGDNVLMESLLPVLGLEDFPPSIIYDSSTNKKEDGAYRREEHAIIVYEQKIGKRGSKKNMILSASEGAKPTIFTRMGVIAHELWHAHQYVGEGVSEEKREKYIKNFVYYMSASNDEYKNASYSEYRHQLIEEEAWAFGKKMKERLAGQYGQIKARKNGRK